MPSSSCWPHSQRQTHSRSLAPPPSHNLLVRLCIQVLAASSKSQGQRWIVPPKSSSQGLRRGSLLIVTFEDPFTLPLEQLSVMITIVFGSFCCYLVRKICHEGDGSVRKALSAQDQAPSTCVKSWTRWQRCGLGIEWPITDLRSSLVLKSNVDNARGRRSKMHLHKHGETYTHT